MTNDGRTNFRTDRGNGSGRSDAWNKVEGVRAFSDARRRREAGICEFLGFARCFPRKRVDGLLENGVWQLPDDVFLLPEDVRQLPDGVFLLPDDVRQLPDDVCLLPDDVRQLPDDDFLLPDDGGQLPDDVFPLPDDGGQLPDDVFLLPEDVRQLPDGVFRGTVGRGGGAEAEGETGRGVRGQAGRSADFADWRREREGRGARDEGLGTRGASCWLPVAGCWFRASAASRSTFGPRPPPLAPRHSLLAHPRAVGRKGRPLQVSTCRHGEMADARDLKF